MILGTATTAKKAPLPDPLYVYCTKMLFALESCRPPHSDHSIPLRLIPAGAQHEVTSPASNLARAPARTLVLCLVFLRRHYWCALPTLRRAAPRPFSLPSPMETEVHRQQPQPRTRSEPAHPCTNPIVPRGGFLQVAVSEAPLHSVSTPSSSLVGASDTALRLASTDLSRSGHPFRAVIQLVTDE